MTTPARPIIGAEVTQPVPESQSPAVSRPASNEMPIAKELPPWDLLPSDLLLVRRRPVNK
ncbi:MAG: hypothetical protein QOE68_4028 [Thermoanaerobaculia bacterium]|jgi:hypothetical protein|nr:hypothetical protein [Thermoanaerobaculia bacterium]